MRRSAMRRAIVHMVLWPVLATLAGGAADAAARRRHRPESEPPHATSHGAPTRAELRREEREAERADPCERLARSRRNACELKEEREARAEFESEGRSRRRTAVASPLPARAKAAHELQPEDLIGGVESPPRGVPPALRGSLAATTDAPGVSAHAVPSRKAAAGRTGRLREVILEDGQSLDDLAASTGVSVADLARLNGIASVEDVPTGMKLKLPAGAAPPQAARLAAAVPPPAAQAPVAGPTVRSAPRELADAGPSAGPRPYSSLGRSGASLAPPPARRGGRTEADALAAYAVASARAPHLADREEARHERFVWPVRAEVVSAFGAHGTGQRNDGVDLAARPGDPVRASAAGEVVYAGKEIATAGGNLVLLKHADGWVTAYSHLGRITVAMRQTVEQGQEIAESPDVAGASVHFEVRQPGAGGAKPVDPVSVLPARGGEEAGRG